MFENQYAFDELQLARCAKELGLDLRQFQREMKGHLHLAKIRARRKAGVRLGVVQAPTFFINSLKHESSFGLTTLLPAVQAAAGGDPESCHANANGFRQKRHLIKYVGNSETTDLKGTS